MAIFNIYIVFKNSTVHNDCKSLKSILYQAVFTHTWVKVLHNESNRVLFSELFFSFFYATAQTLQSFFQKGRIYQIKLWIPECIVPQKW